MYDDDPWAEQEAIETEALDADLWLAELAMAEPEDVSGAVDAAGLVHSDTEFDAPGF
jgi:hypothetical protein